MGRSIIKLWRAPLADLQLTLEEGEMGIDAATGYFYRRPDGQPSAALLRVGGSDAPVTSVNGQTGVVTITSVTGNAGTATRLQTPRLFALGGDVSGSAQFDGSANAIVAVTLGDSGVTAGTYGSSFDIPVFSVDSKGRVTAVGTTLGQVPWSRITSRPTTIAGFGITDAPSLGSPAFTGEPTAPTAPYGTNSLQIASTSFVQAALAGYAPPPMVVITENAALATYFPIFSDVNGGLPSKVMTSPNLTFNPSIGEVTATAFNTTSDERARLNIRDLNYGLSTVLALRGRAFEMRESGRTAIGLIAQEVAPIIPEVVTEAPSGMMSVNYPALVAVLLESIRELEARVRILEG